MKRFHSPFHKRNFDFLGFYKVALKTEDKILLGIGGGFLVGVLLFIIGANTIFTSLRAPSPSPVQKMLPEKEQALDTRNKALEESALEFQQEYQRFHDAFEQSRKEENALFQEAVKDFRDRFEKASKSFMK